MAYETPPEIAALPDAVVQGQTGELAHTGTVYRFLKGLQAVFAAERLEQYNAITGWATENLAAKTHTHTISGVTGLQAALDAKAATSALAGYVTTSAFATELAGKANTGHTHLIGQVTGLQTLLDNLSATVQAASDEVAQVAADAVQNLSDHAALPIHSGGLIVAHWVSANSRWEEPGGNPISAFPGMRKLFLWEQGSPDPTSAMSTRDLVLGNGT